MNYDEYITGLHDENSPLNITQLEEFNSTDLSKCLDFYKFTKDIDPLEVAIDENRRKLELATKLIIELTHVMREVDNAFAANKLCKIRDILNK